MELLLSSTAVCWRRGVWLWAAYRSQWCNQLHCCHVSPFCVLAPSIMCLVFPSWFMSYHFQSCCDTLHVIYFPLSFALPHVLIHSFSFCLSFVLIFALHPSLLSLLSLTCLCCWLTCHRSALLTLTERSCVAEGRGHSLSVLPLFIILLLSRPVFLIWRSLIKVLGLLATLLHPSYVLCSSFFLPLNSFIFVNAYMDDSFLFVFLFHNMSLMGLSLPRSQALSGF